MADNHVIACQGTAAGLQILAGPYKQRLSLVAAEIGTDDVIIGGEILELAQGGFGKPGLWAMTVENKILEIPLIGQHSSNAEVKKEQGAKKIKKLLQEHGRFGQIGFIWKSEGVENSTDSQDEDAQNGLLGINCARLLERLILVRQNRLRLVNRQRWRGERLVIWPFKHRLTKTSLTWQDPVQGLKNDCGKNFPHFLRCQNIYHLYVGTTTGGISNQEHDLHQCEVYLECLKQKWMRQVRF